MGRKATELVDFAIDPENNTLNAPDLLGLSVFISSNPRGSSQSIVNLYELRDSIQGVDAQIKVARSPDERKRLRRQNRDLLLQKGRINRAVDDLSKRWAKINLIYENDRMTSAEKRTRLDLQYENIVRVSRRALRLE